MPGAGSAGLARGSGTVAEATRIALARWADAHSDAAAALREHKLR